MLTIPPPTHEQLIEIMRELCGGSDVADMLSVYHAEDIRDRRSYREIAADHKVSVEVVHRLMARARVRLRRCGLMPAAWERQTSNRPTTAA